MCKIYKQSRLKYYDIVQHLPRNNEAFYKTMTNIQRVISKYIDTINEKEKMQEKKLTNLFTSIEIFKDYFIMKCSALKEIPILK